MDKLEEKYQKEAEHLRIELKIYKEENEALKKALEKKIERVLNVERDLKDANTKYATLEKDFLSLKKNHHHQSKSVHTPPKHEDNNNKQIIKTKYKSNSANPNSGRKTASESMQMFYSRNLGNPNNPPKENMIIPVTSTRSPQKFAINPCLAKNMFIKKEGKSPYIHGDLDKLKQYINVPKTKSHKRSKSQTFKGNQQTRKAVRSALKPEHCHTDETTDDSFYKIRDYNSIQNSIIFRGSKKNVGINKGTKVKRFHKKKNSKNQHFMSYDVRSSLNKYELMNQPCMIDSSVDYLVMKNKHNKKMKTKRNSSISKN